LAHVRPRQVSAGRGRQLGPQARVSLAVVADAIAAAINSIPRRNRSTAASQRIEHFAAYKGDAHARTMTAGSALMFRERAAGILTDIPARPTVASCAVDF
jgi:hypothetical protein